MAFNWSAFGTDSHEREIKVHYVPFTDGKTIDIVLDFMLREDRIFGIDLERKPGMYGPPYPDHIALIQICSPKRCLLIHRTTEMVDTASATTLLRDFFCHPEKTSNPERILIFDGVKNDVPYFRSNFGWKVDAEHARIYSIDDAKWPKWFKVEKRNRLENVLNLITDKLVVGHWGTSFLPHRFVAKDKTISLSAWHRDHLSERQLDYAIFDAWRLAVSWAIVEEHYPQARFKPPSNRSVRVFTCPCCRERFSERTRLGEHLQTEHPDYPALDLSEYCRHTGRLRIPGARRPLLGQPLNQPAAASTPTPAPALTPDGPAPPQSPSETKEEEEEEEHAEERLGSPARKRRLRKKIVMVDSDSEGEGDEGMAIVEEPHRTYSRRKRVALLDEEEEEDGGAMQVVGEEKEGKKPLIYHMTKQEVEQKRAREVEEERERERERERAKQKQKAEEEEPLASNESEDLIIDEPPSPPGPPPPSAVRKPKTPPKRAVAAKKRKPASQRASTATTASSSTSTSTAPRSFFHREQDTQRVREELATKAPDKEGFIRISLGSAPKRESTAPASAPAHHVTRPFKTIKATANAKLVADDDDSSEDERPTLTEIKRMGKAPAARRPRQPRKPKEQKPDKSGKTQAGIMSFFR
eukprot:gnl/Trimastix_PCT/2778.p1 GENE.gnl/Trimastix_PCT/2778~~gnl/Trimastix_PCT/2778.p1  ORF type:complete len:671 (+),score=113.41 gnl/Trimastix_PCT/2778:98-2014(+)